MPGVLLKLLVKDKLPHSREVPMNAKQCKTPDEKERLQQMSTTQHERLAVETPEGKKIIADKNQPA